METDKNLEQKFAPMMKAYLMLMVTGQTSINFINSRKLAKDARESLKAFGLPLSEGQEPSPDLAAFADYYIDSCMHSKSFRSAIFGTMTMSDSGAATRLAEDIEEVTGKTAGKLGIAGEIRPLRLAMFSALLSRVDNGDKLLKELNITP